MSSRARLAAALILLTPLSAFAKDTPACPDAVKGAEKLVLVLSASMNSRTAKAEYFERQGGRWTRTGAVRPAILGAKGLAWSWASQDIAPAGAPVKTEGDRKTPAGFFALGKPFGFSRRKNAGGYVRLEKGEHICVDDPASPHYNSIVPRSKVDGAKGGEDMATIEQYREGLFIDYPTSRARKGGSCIFIHVWRGESSATTGCVALAEPDVVEMQELAAKGKAVIGILPKTAWERLRHCFPGL